MSEAAATRTLERCLACGAPGPRPLAMRYEWQGLAFPLVECRSCGMRFLAVQPTGETLARMYGPEYFECDFRCGRSDRRAFDDDAFHAENDGLLDRFERLRGAGRLLEVGCASGALLKRAAARGWRPTGIEPSHEAVLHARAPGIPVHEGTLETVEVPAAAFDLVYMGDVLEHVPDCRGAVARVARALAPGGHFVLRGPITTHSLARGLGLGLAALAGRTIVLREPPYHLWEFTPRPLARLLAAEGLEPIAMEQAKIGPGHAHGSKGVATRLAMAAIDVVNAPMTKLFNVFGDRIVVVARKPG